jgi:hypothetical protein
MKTPSRYKGIPYQLRWEEEIKEGFNKLVKSYDPLLSINKAIVKLIMFAIKENWLPGYERHSRTISIGTEEKVPTRTTPRRMVDTSRE